MRVKFQFTAIEWQGHLADTYYGIATLIEQGKIVGIWSDDLIPELKLFAANAVSADDVANAKDALAHLGYRVMQTEGVLN